MASLLTKFGTLPVSHHVPDVLQPGLDVVFCGTALGRMSAERKAYYANPGNLFWRTLHRAGFTSHQLPPEAYGQVLQFGIGLTDLCKSAYGNDAELPQGALDVAALREKVLRYQPRYLAFTSKAGAASYLGKDTGAIAYGAQAERVGDTGLYVLPSPSGHARRYWDETVWRALALLVDRA